MAATFIKDITWTAVFALAIILVVCCFLAVLWSKREWNSRKIRVGMFLEREYKTEEEKPAPPPRSDEEDTKEWPTLKKEE